MMPRNTYDIISNIYTSNDISYIWFPPFPTELGLIVYNHPIPDPNTFIVRNFVLCWEIIGRQAVIEYSGRLFLSEPEWQSVSV